GRIRQEAGPHDLWHLGHWLVRALVQRTAGASNGRRPGPRSLQIGVPDPYRYVRRTTGLWLGQPGDGAGAHGSGQDEAAGHSRIDTRLSYAQRSNVEGTRL